MTPIADMVEQMTAEGVPLATILLAVRTAERAAACGKSGGIPVDEAAEKRRAYDRERKARKRTSGGIPVEIRGTSETAITNLDIKKKVRARKHPLPPEWKPKPAHFEAAARMNIPELAVYSKAEDMRLWADSTGALKLNWDATFHVFLRRDASKLAVHGPPKSVELPGFYASFDSPQLTAWEAHERNGGKKYPRDRKGGWRFPTEWPPDYRATG